jgi:hypothetical protein
MDIPFDLLYIVASFHTKPRMKLLDWIPEDKLNLNYLSGNINLPNAIYLLEIVLQHDFHKNDWDTLSANSNLLHAIHILEKYPDKINWKYLSMNLDKSLRDTSFRNSFTI